MTETSDLPRRKRLGLSPAAATAIVAAWLLVLLITHNGPNSPYTYVSELTLGPIPHDLGRIVAPDALTVIAVTRFFYDGTLPAKYDQAHNLWLPLHSFTVSVGGAFIRNYLWSNYAINVLFLLLLTVAVLRFGMRHGLRAEALVLALLTLYSLPPIVSCIGQPLHYIVGPVISFLVVLTAVALDPEDLRNPWIAGGLTAVLTLNYHWYVFAAALVTYLTLLRFRRRRDDLIYVVVAVAPVVIWELFMRGLTAGQMSKVIRNRLLMPPLFEWADYLAHPVDRVLMPLIVTQIGVVVAFHHIVASIHWPLLALAMWALWRARPSIGSFPGNRLVVLLVGFYLLEQLITAAWDFENPPRRAFPFFFAFAWVYCWVVDRFFEDRSWWYGFVGLFVLSAFFAFADVALNRSGGAFLYVGEAVRGTAKEALLYETREMPPAIATPADPQQLQVRGFLPRASFQLTPAFVFAQSFVAFWMMVLFWLVARARLLPRAAPWIAASIWLVSLAARLV